MRRFSRRIGTLVATVGVLAAGLQLPGSGKRSRLEGVWKRVAKTYTGPDTTWTIPTPQPSLYIFTKGYYSVMWVPRTRPRKLFGAAALHRVEKLDAFDSFRASSGSYEVGDSTITLRPVVPRVPNLGPDWAPIYVYRIHGDSLSLTIAYQWARDPTRTASVRVRLLRLE